MKRRDILFAAAVAVLVPSGALAQSMADRIVAELQAQGFSDIRTGTTLLGRGRVLAVGPEGEREIIFNPRTGEILRDLWRVGEGGSPSGRRLLGSDRSGSDGGGSGSSGSGSSGSGSSGSGSGGDDQDDDADDDSDDDGDDSDGDDSGGSGSDGGSGGDDSDDDSDDR